MFKNRYLKDNLSQPFTLQVGEKIGWDIESLPKHMRGDTCSIPESGVLLYSLMKSRMKWIYNTFPKLQEEKPVPRGSKTAASKADTPITHSKTESGSCDFIIGPHTYSNTRLWKVYHAPAQPPQDRPSPPSRQPNDRPEGGEANGPLDWHEQVDDYLLALSACALHSDPDAYFKLEHAFVDKAIKIYHNDWSQDPILCRATQVVVPQIRRGEPVDPEQAQVIASAWRKITSTNPPRSSMPLEIPDLAIQFQEAKEDFWLIPRKPAILDWKGDRAATLTLCPPFGDPPPVGSTAEGQLECLPQTKEPGKAVTITLTNITDDAAEFLKSWVEAHGAMDEGPDAIEMLGYLSKDKQSRSYLAYQFVPDKSANYLSTIGNLLQAYATKPMKQTPTYQRPTRPKKSSKQKIQSPSTDISTPQPATGRFQAEVEALSPGIALIAASHVPLQTPTSAAPTEPTAAPNDPNTTPSYHPSPYASLVPPSPYSYAPPPPLTCVVPYPNLGLTTASYAYPAGTWLGYNTGSYHTPVPPPPPPTSSSKRQRDSNNSSSSQSKHPRSIELQCSQCGIQDVALVLGGRFCRPCSESARVDQQRPQHSQKQDHSMPSMSSGIPQPSASALHPSHNPSNPSLPTPTTPRSEPNDKAPSQ